MAAKLGRSLELNNALERVRDVLRDSRKLAEEAFAQLDTDHDGCLVHLDVVRLMRQLIPGKWTDGGQKGGGRDQGCDVAARS